MKIMVFVLSSSSYSSSHIINMPRTPLGFSFPSPCLDVHDFYPSFSSNSFYYIFRFSFFLTNPLFFLLFARAPLCVCVCVSGCVCAGAPANGLAIDSRECNGELAVGAPSSGRRGNSYGHRVAKGGTGRSPLNRQWMLGESLALRISFLRSSSSRLFSLLLIYFFFFFL